MKKSNKVPFIYIQDATNSLDIYKPLFNLCTEVKHYNYDNRARNGCGCGCGGKHVNMEKFILYPSNEEAKQTIISFLGSLSFKLVAKDSEQLLRGAYYGYEGFYTKEEISNDDMWQITDYENRYKLIYKIL